MKVAIIIVGIGQWEEYTRPLIDSIRKYEPNIYIIVVDNGNNYPVYYNNVHFIITKKIVHYSVAINLGKSLVSDNADWIIVINNDVVCKAPFIKILETMNTKILYGNDVHGMKHPKFKSPTIWLDGWLYAIPKEIFDAVGEWDENFHIAGFEDADYCFRTYKLGYKIKESKLPFKHLEYHIRKKVVPDYPKHRMHNMKYLVKKHGLKWL